MRVILFVIKKRKRRPISFLFFNDADIFFKCFNPNHNHRIPSLFSKCFSWFFYLGMHRGIGVFSWFYFSLLLWHMSRSRACLALASRLPLFDQKTLKNCACSADPGLLNVIKGSRFPLSFRSSYQYGW